MSTDTSSASDSSASSRDEDLSAPLSAFEDKMYEYTQQASSRHHCLSVTHQLRVIRHDGYVRLGGHIVDFAWYLEHSRSMAKGRQLRSAGKRWVAPGDRGVRVKVREET